MAETARQSQEMEIYMAEAQLQQEWRRVMVDAKSVMPEGVRDAEPINDGLAPAKGFKIREIAPGQFREKEKKRCEDRKIKDIKHGLFMVADGVSTGEGAVAAEITARYVQDRLGANLDALLLNLKASGEATPENISDLVAREIQRAVRDANEAIMKLQKKDWEYKNVASSLSVSKLVELPDGSQRLFFANVADSRIYLQRNKRLQRLTKDDSMVQLKIDMALSRGEISIDDARLIDQHTKKDQLSETQQQIARGRATITAMMGAKGKAGRLEYDPYNAQIHFYSERSDDEYDEVNNDMSDVRWINVQQGDRLVIDSDGVHDNLTEIEMNDKLNDNLDDAGAEKAIQEASVDMMRAGLERSKGDDVAILVHEIGDSRKEVPPEVLGEIEPRPYTAEIAASWPRQIQDLDKQLLAARRELVRLEKEGADAIEILQQERAFNGLEQQRSGLEYWIARAAADEVKDNLPPRFETGQAVQMRTKSGQLDARSWQIKSFDPNSETYLVALPNKSPERISRLQLESLQDSTKLKFDDIISLPVTGEKGRKKIEGGFRLLGYTKEGKVLLEKKSDGKRVRYVISEETATRHMRDDLQNGALYEREMEARLGELKALKQEGKELKNDFEAYERHQARQKAQKSAK